MFFKQFYLGCLAHASYMLGDNGEAVVVDPQRDVAQYLEEARREQLTIRYVIETHLHADFVSGHVELAKKTGAKIYLGHEAGAKFPHVAVHDGDEIKLGRLNLRFLETPGHTPESLTVLVIDPQRSDSPQMILTGDTLFIGDVGRPDLAGSQGKTASEMAGLLYDSLWNKILKLPDETLVYPAHGAGSSCGRNMSEERFSTLGEQRRTNHALKPMPKASFIQMATADLPEAPTYFSHDAEANRQGAKALDELPVPEAVNPQTLSKMQRNGCIVLDTRETAVFGAGHIPGSINIALSGTFASWAGTLIGLQENILIVAEDEPTVSESVMRLARVGIEAVKGYLKDGFRAWEKSGDEVRTLPQINVSELKQKNLAILDVRSPAEYAESHIASAVSHPLAKLVGEGELKAFPKSAALAVICGSGYRSSAAASLLEAKGYTQLYNVTGGMKAWNAAGFPTMPTKKGNGS